MKDITNDLTDDIYEIVSNNIRKIRKNKGWTQEKLAIKSSLSHEYIRRIESKKGKKNISLNTVQIIAKSLDIPFKELFNK